METERTTSPTPILPADLAARLAASLRDLRFGTLEIKVHEGKVMEIVEHRRVRFTATAERLPIPEL